MSVHTLLSKEFDATVIQARRFASYKQSQKEYKLIKFHLLVEINQIQAINLNRGKHIKYKSKAKKQQEH